MGRKLEDFTLIDEKGKKVNTANLRGQIIWIDSWASKCGPCIKKLKQIKSTYEQFHGKGFEILALSWDYTVGGYMKSLDDAKKDWIKVMDKHNFSWLNVFDEKDAIKRGRFGSVGKNLLVDENGIIIGYNLHPLEIEPLLLEKLK